MAFTMETSKVVQGGAYRDVFNSIGLSWASDMYEGIFNKFFHRKTLISSSMWLAKIQKAGFMIERSQDIISPTITKLFDIFLLTSWPSQLFKPILARRHVYRPKLFSDVLVRVFLKSLKDSDKDGTNLFVVARKPGQTVVRQK